LRPAYRRGSAVAIVGIGTLTLVFAPQVVYGFQHSFLPIFSKWTYSGTFFAGGVAVAIFDPSLRTMNRLARRNFVLGIIATIAAVLLGCWSLRAGQSGSLNASTSWLIAISLASTTVLAAWSLTLGLIGLANRISPQLAERKRVRQCIEYLAGASFWIYLVHHPIVGLVHTDLKWIVPSLAPVVKSLLTAMIAIGFGLMTYEVLVRRSRFGFWIGLTSLPKIKATNPVVTVDSMDAQPTIRIAA
jgi:glucans biosynthesis protein C